MAGKLGMKGGGGARPGAGRKPSPKPAAVPVPDAIAQLESGKPFDPRPTLEQVALGLLEVSPQQYKALTALLPYVHQKLGEGGKKDQKADAAKTAAKGKFAPSAAPKLVVNNK